MGNPVIEVKRFTKTYGDFIAVNDISFEVKPGEIFGLLGPNGAGKTTTLESLEGLRMPDRGSLRIMGVDPTRDSRKLRNIIGVQLQTSALPDSIQVDESMEFFCAYHEVNPQYDLLERLGLGDRLKTQYFQLSTGQKRRLALALAIAHKPNVLILDEPTAGLDVPSRVELHKLIRELKEAGTTVLLATHDMAEAEEMTDRVAILLKGEIVTIGTPLEITATGAELTKVSVRTSNSCLVDAEVIFSGLSQIALKDEYVIFFSENIGPTVAAIIDYIETQADTIIDLRVERPSLEDRFLEITDGGNAQ